MLHLLVCTKNTRVFYRLKSIEKVKGIYYPLTHFYVQLNKYYNILRNGSIIYGSCSVTFVHFFHIFLVGIQEIVGLSKCKDTKSAF